ncbi:MAG: DUF3310 domain-containing protein [Synergistaceae bacterium]|nr:DUF3310 domain-containing protein [Synergistaceae bacterium]
MFRTEEKTEFEDSFFDDMIKNIEKLAITKPEGNYDGGWNSALKNCVYKLYSFFGKGTPSTTAMNIFSAPEKEPTLFDDLVSEILKVRIPHPVYDDHKAWNSAVHVCLNRLYTYFGKGELPQKITDLFMEKTKITHDNIAHDNITHPSWYTQGGIETLDFIAAKELNFMRGNTVKYITRAGKKDPAREIEDLEKARFYLDWEINRLKGKA